jgi:phosphatidylglycerophosphate synthase
MVDWHLGMVEEEDGRPAMLGAADACTLARAWLVPVAADAAHPAAVALAAASDVLDGRLARASRTTRAGRDLEGLVDLCFAIAALRGARRAGGLSRAAVAAELARLGAGLGFTLWTYFGRAVPPSPALVRAARLLTPVRVAGMLAAGAGRRREADVLVLTGAAVSVGLVATGAARGPGLTPARSRPPPSGRHVAVRRYLASASGAKTAVSATDQASGSSAESPTQLPSSSGRRCRRLRHPRTPGLGRASGRRHGRPGVVPHLVDLG